MKLIAYIILGVLVGLAVAFFELPTYTIALVIGAIFILGVGNILYTTLMTQNLKRLEKFIQRNSKNPVYYSLQMLAQGSDEAFQESLEAIVKKYKHTKYEATYGALLAMMKKDFDEAHRYNEPQLHKEVGQYTDYIIKVMAGEEIGEVPAFKQSWMNSSIEAHKAFMKKDLLAFEVLSKQAIADAKGIQYYGNYYTFKRMHEQLTT